MNVSKSAFLPLYNLTTKLRNVRVKIPLLQALKDILIYAKTVRELCLKNPGRKRKDPSTIHLIGESVDLIIKNNLAMKYIDPGNPIVSMHINGKFSTKYINQPQRNHQYHDFANHETTRTAKFPSYPNYS